MQNTPLFVAPGIVRGRGGNVIVPAEFGLSLERVNARLDAILAEEVAA